MHVDNGCNCTGRVLGFVLGSNTNDSPFVITLLRDLSGARHLELIKYTNEARSGSVLAKTTCTSCNRGHMVLIAVKKRETYALTSVRDRRDGRRVSNGSRSLAVRTRKWADRSDGLLRSMKDCRTGGSG